MTKMGLRIWITFLNVAWLAFLLILLGMLDHIRSGYYWLAEGSLLPVFAQRFSLPIMGAPWGAWTDPVVALVAWGVALALPLLTIVLTWVRKDADCVRRWFFHASLFELAWFVAISLLAAFGALMPFLPIGTRIS